MWSAGQGWRIQWKSGSAALHDLIGCPHSKQTEPEPADQGLEVGLSACWIVLVQYRPYSVLISPRRNQSDQQGLQSFSIFWLTLRWYRPVCICASTMVVPESQDKMHYPPNDLQKDAHVPDFNSYLALYRKSLENPEGRSNLPLFLVHCLQCFLAIHLSMILFAYSICLC